MINSFTHKNLNSTLIKAVSLFLVCFCLFASWRILASDDAKKDLDNVKQEIKKQKSNIKLTAKQQQQIETQLREDDLKIAAAAARMNETINEQTQVKQKLASLNKQQKELQAKKQQQESILGEQIRSAYSAGHHDYLKLLLNQERPDNVQRTLTYYQYLNDARMESIESFDKVLVELMEVEQQQQQQAEKLAVLIDQQSKQKKEIESNQQQRKSTLKTLNSQILSSKQRLNKLEGEEKSLIQTLAKIQAQLQKQKELKGLKNLKRKLKWPVKGRIAHSFGTKKQGYLRWKGVLMNAPTGRSVNTIHNGTVLFSDWLKGYGLVIVIDHGDGYMSLYGHNQALLKNVGDRVEIGEPIALVGQSGGLGQPGVYFEIRHKGKPMNPKSWCR